MLRRTAGRTAKPSGAFVDSGKGGNLAELHYRESRSLSIQPRSAAVLSKLISEVGVRISQAAPAFLHGPFVLILASKLALLAKG